ncbi:MAG: type II toxin-antitoxin system PemK/MazF family toxin [Alkalispirochaeta sp.]
MTSIQRYHAYRVHLDPVIGGEVRKTRPAVVISDSAMNRRLDTVVVCPVTSRLHPHWPSRVQCELAGQPAEIAIDRIRTVSRRRIGEEVGTVSQEVAAAIRHVITEMYGVLSVE